MLSTGSDWQVPSLYKRGAISIEGGEGEKQIEMELFAHQLLYS